MRRNKAAARSTRRSDRPCWYCRSARRLGLAGCGSIDDMLFGSDTPTKRLRHPQAARLRRQPERIDRRHAARSHPKVRCLRRRTPVLPTAGITPVTIEPGTDTGTAVSHTIASLRSEVSGIQDKIIAEAQQLADLRAAALQSSQQYHEAKASITARLQLGTTRGNPELVGAVEQCAGRARRA